MNSGGWTGPGGTYLSPEVSRAIPVRSGVPRGYDTKRMNIDLSGQVAIVTGAGRGIGKEIASVFARCGATVVLAARSGDQLAEVAVPRRLYRAILERIRRFTALSPRAAPI